MSIELIIVLINCLVLTFVTPAIFATANIRSAIIFKVGPALLGVAVLWTQRIELLALLTN